MTAPLIVGALLALAPPALPQGDARIELRGAADSLARRELGRAETAFHVVDSLFAGALPARVVVDLSGTGAPATVSDTAIRLDPAFGRQLLPQLTRQLSRIAVRRLLGDAAQRVEHGFLLDGLAEWAVLRVVGDPERAKWSEMWAAYAYREQATYLEFLAEYERARDDLGSNVLTAVGVSLVSLLVDHHGLDRLHEVLAVLASGADLCAALERAGPGCRQTLDAWEVRLRTAMDERDFALLPEVRADLYATATEDGRYDLELGIAIDYPEGGSFDYVVEAVVAGTELDQAFAAEGDGLGSRVPLGSVEPGTRVRWRVAVWSSRYRLWRHSGWQSRMLD